MPELSSSTDITVSLNLLPCAVYIPKLEIYPVFGLQSILTNIPYLVTLPALYLLTYLLHGAESFLRSQLVNFAASQEIPRIYGTRKFLSVPTSARHPSLS